jgi:uncharacterized membrane protein (DUF373 family)
MKVNYSLINNPERATMIKILFFLILFELRDLFIAMANNSKQQIYWGKEESSFKYQP